MRVSLLTILLFLCSLLADAQKEHPFLYRIIFAGYFYSEQIDLELEGKRIVTGKILHSGTNGATGFWITRQKDILMIQQGPDKTFLKMGLLNSRLKMTLAINGKQTDFNLNLKNGKIIGVNYSVPPGMKERVLRLDQGSRYPTFL